MNTTTKNSARPSSARAGGLSLEDIRVSFGATKALGGVTLTVAPHEIVGLMGHNGAGKSTLLKVATGALTPDEGRVVIGGESVEGSPSPRRFAELGVTVIHQEPALAPNLSIFDNLFLARDVSMPRRHRRARAREALEQLGVHLELDLPVDALTTGQRQLIDLCRGMMFNSIKALFLDEPAAALGHEDTELLHQRIRALAAQGTSVVYVSHRLPDILDVCDRIVVLQEGSIVLDQPRAGYTSRTLSAALAPSEQFEDFAPAPSARPVSLSVRSNGSEFAFAPGEVVGLFGVASGPQFTILEALAGRGADAVTASIDGKAYAPKHALDARRAGVHLVPADRDKEGLVPNLSAQDNVFLPWLHELTSRGAIDRGRMHRLYADIRDEFNIRGPEGEAAITSFSGGNRQKHLLARWMSVIRPRVLLLAQPTQGVDEAAKADIRRAVRRLLEIGTCVIVASAEADEITTMCDRVYVVTPHGATALSGDDDLELRMLDALFTSDGSERENS